MESLTSRILASDPALSRLRLAGRAAARCARRRRRTRLRACSLLPLSRVLDQRYTALATLVRARWFDRASTTAPSVTGAAALRTDDAAFALEAIGTLLGRAVDGA